MPVTRWLHCADHQLAPMCRSVTPLKVGRIGPGYIPGIRIGDMEGSEFGLWSPVRVVGALEGQEHQLEARLHAVGQVVETFHIALVHPPGGLVGAAGVEVEEPLEVLRGVQWTEHARGDGDPAAPVTDTGQVGVTVPHPGRIEPKRALWVKIVVASIEFETRG